jgi:hypothetical protein
MAKNKQNSQSLFTYYVSALSCSFIAIRRFLVYFVGEHACGFCVSDLKYMGCGMNNLHRLF